MIDLGCTGYLFIDLKIAHSYYLPITPLSTPRSLETFEGQPVNNVTHMAKTTMDINRYSNMLPSTLLSSVFTLLY